MNEVETRSLPQGDYQSSVSDSVCISALGPSTNWHESKHFKFTLYRTGSGEISHDWCGMIRNFVACSSPSHHGSKPIHMSCKRLSCPLCYEDACTRAAHRAEDRVVGMKKAWMREGVNVGRIRHVEWSPSPRDWPRDRVESDGGKAFIKEWARVFKSHSKHFGGVRIIHWERKKHTDGSACEDKFCKRKHVWVWGPHVHYVGWGWFNNSALVHHKTGWVYKTIDDGAKVRNVFDTVRYQLTHAGLVKRELRVKESLEPVHDLDQVGNALSYVGMCSTNKGGKSTLRSTLEPCYCEVCQSELHRYGALNDKSADFSYDLGAVKARVVEFEYRLSVRLQQQLDRWLQSDDSGPPS